MQHRYAIQHPYLMGIVRNAFEQLFEKLVCRYPAYETYSFNCTAHTGTCHHGTGRYPAKQQGNTGANADHQQNCPAMMLDVEKGFLECVLYFLCRTFRRGRCVLCGFLCLPQLLCIVPLDPLFLQKAV